MEKKEIRKYNVCTKRKKNGSNDSKRVERMKKRREKKQHTHTRHEIKQ